jgi:SAM-dependent methyltransferase
MGSIVKVPPDDWYRSGFPPKTAAMPWADRTEAEVDRAIVMLKPHGGERILDLACGIGRHSRELRKRGFEVVGVDISPELLEMAERETSEEGLDVTYLEADLRELELREEFDIVLSLNDGAVGYFETDAENYRTFEVVAQALRQGGGHLMQLPKPNQFEIFVEGHKGGGLSGEEPAEKQEFRYAHPGSIAIVTGGLAAHRQGQIDAGGGRPCQDRSPAEVRERPPCGQGVGLAAHAQTLVTEKRNCIKLSDQLTFAHEIAGMDHRATTGWDRPLCAYGRLWWGRRLTVAC